MLEVERKVVDATQIVDFLVTANDENLTDNHYLRTKTSESLQFPLSLARQRNERAWRSERPSHMHTVVVVHNWSPPCGRALACIPVPGLASIFFAEKIRTAVVKCNFADSETLMASVAERCRNHKVGRSLTPRKDAYRLLFNGIVLS